MSRKILCICSVATLLSVAGCGSSPETVVEKFYRSVEKGEISEAKKTLSAQLVAMLGEQKLSATLADETSRITKCGGIKAIRTTLDTKGEVSAGTAIVEYDGKCQKRSEKVKLVKEDGNWKLTANK